MFKEAEDLFEELRKLHLQAERHFFSLLAPSTVHPTAEGKWQPLADIYETNEAWVIKLELAPSGDRGRECSVPLVARHPASSSSIDGLQRMDAPTVDDPPLYSQRKGKKS